MLEQVVRLTVVFVVNEGQIDAFKAIALEMTEGAQAEPGTLGYEWFVSNDGQRFTLLETYADIAAIEAHFLGPVVQQLVPKIGAVSSIDGFEFFGDPGPKVSALAAKSGASFHQYSLGIDR